MVGQVRGESEGACFHRRSEAHRPVQDGRALGYRRGVPSPPSPPESRLADAPVEVRRSKRRKRTVQAYLRDDTVVVLLPARMSKAEERYWVAVMVQRLQGQEHRQQRRRQASDADLFARAGELSRRYLDGKAHPAEVRWVTNQNDRWGSCTPESRTIRLSARLRELPGWVADYVLVHELAHLLEPGHGKVFWRLVERYPKTERARGFLEGVAAAAGLPTEPCDDAAPSAETEVNAAAERVGADSEPLPVGPFEDAAAAPDAQPQPPYSAGPGQDALW